MESPIPLNWAHSVANFTKLCQKSGLMAPKISQLSDLAVAALDPAYTRLVLACFEPICLQIVCQWLEPNASFDKNTVFATLCAVSTIYPQVLSLVEHFLLVNPETFDAPEPILKAIYQLLSYQRARFVSFVKPSALYALISSDNQSTRALAILILGLYIGVSEALVDKWLLKYCGNVANDVKFLPVELALYNSGDLTGSWSSADGAGLDIEPSPLLANVGGLLIPKLTLAPSNETPFIATPTSLFNIRLIGQALLLNKPILLKGSSGSGKTFYVECLLEKLRPDTDITRIHLGEQTDSKALIGTYSTGEKPGTFEWKQGILTSAVTQGKWVLIEDLDKAPTDVISTLLPLLEKRELLIPSRDEIITANHGFQLFATISTNKKHQEIIGQRLWENIEVQAPTESDLVSIIQTSYPQIASLADQFVQVYLTLQDIYSKKHQIRPISTRDLFKWAARTSRIIAQSGPASAEGEIPNEVFDDIFREAVRCFTAFSDNSEFTMSIAEIIGEALDIGSSKVQPLLTHYIPRIVDTSDDSVTIGCAELPKRAVSSMMRRSFTEKCQKFAMTNHGVRLLEQIAVAVAGKEPLLLSGETGTGKTTIVQHLANMTNRKIVVINISQQMEASDLIGGFKPVDVKMIAGSLLEEFDELFDSTFSRAKNQQFCTVLSKAISKNSWKNVVKLWREAFKMVQNLTSDKKDSQDPPTKKRRLDTVDMAAWREFLGKVSAFEIRAQELQNAIIFQFIEGLLIKATRRGDWVLLDEINLAPADTLEGIVDLLNNPPSLTLLEKGGDEVVKSHPEFRLFACMNPATDFGKKDLPEGIRSRFTEIYVRSPDEDIDDLRFIIDKYIGRLKMNDTHIVNDIAELFLEAKRLSTDHSLVDGAGQRPHFSIRTLSRTLSYSGSIATAYGLRRALYEGFCMSFLTLLDKDSIGILEPLIFQHLLGRVGNAKSLLASLPPQPDSDYKYIQFKHYWIRQGEHEVIDDSKYIITPSVETNLLNLVRATATKKFPVLIQGPTSSGKTSMIKYLAGKTGHKFVRINNHEHTDIQEYLGTYVTDKNGVLVFQEGILVEAVRNGYWIVLDELNLAPTDVLEALNRLLDDNREILIPETQEVVRPHPDFMLFATQNPPGVYAGRKILSRAFRNRFLELHFDDIPQDELELILKDRCQIAPTYAKKIVDVYKDLAAQRQSTRVFEQKNSFATLRDLFRWALREAVGYEQLAFNGYLLLGERVRSASEKKIVKESIEKVMRVKIDIDYESMAPADIIARSSQVIWTKAMKRLLVLVLEAIKQNEPILLVGETGCGKTTVCQVLSEIYQIPLNIVNAHQNTETGDLIGSQRPVRNRSEISTKLAELLATVYPDLSFADAKSAYRAGGHQNPEIDSLMARSEALFEWVDGPLVSSMKQATYFLLDEISLADDSVLERLNSVLEPERTLLLPEKGSDDIHVSGAPGFQFFATMNPGGDYGKKELSPALRNRFTEIWVPSMEDFDDVALIIENKLAHKEFTRVITEFSHHFAYTFGHGNATSGVISLRDIINWVDFVNAAQHLEPSLAVLHGGCMVFIDSIGSNALSHLANSPELLKENRASMVKKLCEILQTPENVDEYFTIPHINIGDQKVDFGKFSLDRIKSEAGEPFSLQAPTTAMNAMRVVRSMVIEKPILLEGSPGVGKTSLVSAIANITGQKLTRINLSDQTDLADLFGSDAPTEGSKAGEFTWRDAPFLRALQQGEWVLLDEMNLAPQQVLEGLNACLDHRGEAYIPELDRSFKKHPEFRVFAAQNPQAQGGGRKGLPKSFVNRFSVVYMDSLVLPDLELITQHLYPDIPKEISSPLVRLIEDLNNAVGRTIGFVGQPFEFNLRDTMRWFSLCQSYGMKPVEFFNLIVVSRFRSDQDRETAWKMYRTYFDDSAEEEKFNISSGRVIAGHSIAERSSDLARIQNPLEGHLQCNILLLETAITCVQQNWPLILVGPTLSGKTSFLRYLAYLSGATLKEFSMSADIDSTDLLGGFDQVERGQQLVTIWSRIEDHIMMTLDGENIALLEATRSRNLEHAKILLKDNEAISQMIAEYEDTDFDIPKFKWIDGVLVRAIENGYWLVLDNANLCNPSVLDRLNSLLEINGSLFINECAEADGEPRKVKAHPNFRLFMTVDPKYGELSRAMRNRGVEVFIDSLETRATDFDLRVMGMPPKDHDATISSLSLSNEMPVVSKLPVWNSNVESMTLFTDLSRTANPHWTSLIFLSQQNSAFIKEFPNLDAKAYDLTQYMLKYLDQVELNQNDALLPVGIDHLFETKVTTILEDLKIKLDTAVENAKTKPESEMNLVELSILSRTKTSIHVLDAYGFLYTALNEVDWKKHVDAVGTFALFANLLFQREFDQSRVPVFRDLLVDFIGGAARFINLHFDFSKGGFGLENLWKEVSVGFPNEDAWKLYERLLQQVQAFDGIARECLDDDKPRITSIRESLCMFISDLSRGNVANAGLITVLEEAVQSLKAASRKGSHFIEAFAAIQARVRLNHWALPQQANFEVLSNLEFYSGNNTIQLAQDYNADAMLPWLDPNNDFIAPTIECVRTLDQVSGVVYHQAVQELQVIANLIEGNPGLLGGNKYETLYQRLVNQLSHLSGESNGGSDSFLSFAERLVRENLPWCVFDPAIRQHVLYENYCIQKNDAEADLAHWKATRSIFVSDSPLAIDRRLQEKLDQLEVQPAPSIYRPRVSRISRIYGEISSIRTLIEPGAYTNMSEEQLAIWNSNIQKVVDRLDNYTDYKDIVDVFRGILLTLKLAVNLEHAKRGPTMLWLLNPVKTSLEPKKLSELYFRFSQTFKPVRIHVLRAAQYFNYVEVKELCDSIFVDLYMAWTAKRLEDVEKAQLEAKDFRQGDEESTMEEDFHKLFPDYEGEVPTDGSRETRNDNYDLCTAYFNIFSEDTNEALDKNLEYLMGAFDHIESGRDDPAAFPAILLALSNKIRVSKTEVGDDFNFYIEPSHVESARAIEFASTVQTRIKQLLEQWPEHETLLILANSAQEVCDYPASTPVARYLQKIEQIYHYLDEWQKFASKDVSVAPLIDLVTALIVSWRRLELRTWPSLFEHEKRATETVTAGFWFHLYENLIYNPGKYPESVDYSEIVRILVLFISGSSFGQYQTRVRLVSAFASHAAIAVPRVAECIHNVLGFYEQYSEFIAKMIHDKEKSLAKDIKEVILLASWKDVNIASLKQSAQRSHRSLYKIVRKYREFVNKPASEILSNEPPASNAKFSPLMRFDADLNDLITSTMPETSASNRPKHLLNLPKRAEMMIDYSEQVCGASIPDLLDLATSTIEEAERLSKETPAYLTEENKKEVSSLRVEKGRLLTETLKVLKDAGVGTNIKANTIEDQSMISKVLSETNNLAHSEYFYRVVDLLPRLRSAAQSSESDVPVTDLRRGMAFAENLVNILLKQRQSIVDVLASDLEQSRVELVSIRDLDEGIYPILLDNEATSFKRLGNILEFIGSFGGNQTHLGSIAKELRDLSSPTITTTRWYSSVENCFEALKSALANTKPLTAAISTDLLTSSTDSPTVSLDKSAVGTIDESIIAISSSVLVIIQESLKFANEIDNISDEKWLTKSTKLLRKLGQTLRVGMMRKKFLELITDIKKCSDPEVAKQLVHTIIPFAVVYAELVRVVRSKMELNLFNNTKAVYDLMKLLQSIATRGFCSPQEESHEEQDTSQMQSGTGLGDGEGAQSSKHDEDDEEQPDLDDISQQANKDQKQKDGSEEDQEDNAIEMEGDMAGELEDYENKESDAEDEEDRDDDDIDDEVGDIDNLDPNAVDEKMWDDETNSKKEKETDENVNGQEGEMEAGDDEEDISPPQNDDNAADNQKDDDDDAGSDVEESDGEAAQDDEMQTGGANEELEDNVEERDALDLPEDMQLDSGEEDQNDMDIDDLDDGLDAPEEQEQEPEESAEQDPTNEAANDESGDEDPNLDGVAEEINEDPQADPEKEEGGDENEEDQRNSEAEEEPNAENGGEDNLENDAMDVDTEGLHGPDQSEQIDEQQTTRSEQKSEMSGEGANQEVAQEQDAMDTGETSAASTLQNLEKKESEEQSRKDNSEALKELGDALKEFYDRQKDIQEQSERDDAKPDVEKDVNFNPDEMEHIGDADDFDAQALGKVTEDVKQDIDQDMAIHDEEDMGEADNNEEVEQKHAADDEVDPDSVKDEGDAVNDGSAPSDKPSDEEQTTDSIVNLPGQDVKVEDEDSDDMEDERTPVSRDDAGEMPLRDLSESRELWKTYDAKTHDLSLVLCEQLRLILEPTLATKLRGDYKTGKRLNMKRIIPFIASNFKKDKIWLRRTKPSKREYQVMIAVDDSKSMGEPTVVDLAFQAIALVSNALTQVEAGDLAIAKFGQETEIVHDFNSPFNSGAGANVLRHFGFNQDRTDVCRLMSRSLEVFDAHLGGSSSEKWRLQIILSDGIYEDHDQLRKLVREAHDNRIMVVFVVLDALNKGGSILEMNQVNYTTDANGNMKLNVDRYMDRFPFEYYVIVRNIQDLPHVMSSVLRQYFQAIE